MTEKLRTTEATMEEAADRLSREVAIMASRLERERAKRLLSFRDGSGSLIEFPRWFPTPKHIPMVLQLD